MAQTDKLRTPSGAILSILRGHDLSPSDFNILARLIKRMKLADGHWEIVQAWRRALKINSIPSSHGDFGIEEELLGERRKSERRNAHLTRSKQLSPYRE